MQARPGGSRRPDLSLPIPAWMGIWFALFPTAESIVAQVAAAALVIGSYVVAKDRARQPPTAAGRDPGHAPGAGARQPH